MSINKMSLEQVIKYIRKEEVALWTGAGFSLYAGFPSGKQLQQILYNEFTKEEKLQIDSNSSLRYTAGALVTFRNESRNELNRILKREFSKEPTSKHFHEILCRIPHFKSIITTNYDSLLEDSFTRRADVIRSGRDVPYIDSQRVSIYKPHGDLETMDKIVITENDYAKFYNYKHDDPLWITILDILFKKKLLFLGYGFEDDNVWAWFDLIDNAVETNRNERFLIAPDWPEIKVKQLQARHITYINMSADVFLSELNEALTLNIVSDLENGIVSQDTFNQFISFHELNSKIINEDGKPTLASLYSTKKGVYRKITMQIASPKIANQLGRFNRGFGKDIKIPVDQIMSFEHFVEGFKLNSTYNDLDYLLISRNLILQTCGLEFPDDDLLIEQIEFKSYKISQKKVKIEATVYGFKIDVILQITPKRGVDITANFTMPNNFPSIFKCINFYKALLNYSNGKKALFVWNSIPYEQKVNNVKFDISGFSKTLQFFENLRKIEKTFNIRFEGVEMKLSNSAFRIVTDLSNLIDNKYISLDYENGILIQRKEEYTDKFLKEFPDNVDSLLIYLDKKEVFNLYGHTIDLGEVALEVLNIEPLVFNSDKTTAEVRSKTGQYLKRYSSLYSFDSVINID